MTEMIGRGDRQRGVARLTLALVAAILLLLTVEGMWSPFTNAFAQSPDASPTGTATATGGSTSPAPGPTPSGTQIQFLNPSKYASPEYVSIKPDADGTYHLVAWVSSPPPDAVVEFEIQEGSNPARSIGVATRVGGATTGDTFELRWELRAEGQPVEDGDYVLRAVLYSGGPSPSSPSTSPSSPSASASSPSASASSPSASPSEPAPSPSGRRVIATDQENVDVDRSRETVEILQPANPGELGVYDPDGTGERNPGFVVVVQTSQGADAVRVYYSRSAPGSEPSWTTCVQQTTVSYSDNTRRIGCTIPDDTPPSSITALAAVAVENVSGSTPSRSCLIEDPTPIDCNTPTPIPPSTRTESGDAHRVASTYEADPRSVVVEGNPNATRNTCHELTARVLDQRGEEVWRANVDVHAVGPADSLQFATTERTSNFKAADAGSHSGTEPTFDCEENSGDPNRNQAEHQRVGEPDEKHIESLPNQGTDLEGEFVFALRSVVFGETDVTAWADEDDDDFNDSDNPGEATDPRDPQGTFTITWAAQSPGSPQSPSDPSGSSPSASSPSASSPSASSPSASSPSSPAPSGLVVNCDPETDTNPVRSSHTIFCRVSRATASPSPSGAQVSGVRVHAEAEGRNDPDGTNSPGTPDFTQCVTNDEGTCTFTHGPGGEGTTNEVGTTVYRAWIDSNNNAASEADFAEGRDEVQQRGGPVEPDNTDVVEKTWQRAPLDCEPEQDGNPVGTSHTVTCRAATVSGPTGNVQIDVEATGANDPDNGNSLDAPDFTCTTNASGECTFTHGPAGTGSTTNEGLTTYRAWIDQDSSNATPEADQGEGRDEVAEPGATESDETDVVEKRWTRPPASIVMEPDSDSASVGTCNPFTITVRGDNTQPVAGVQVDVEQRHERADNQTNDDEPRVSFCTPTSAGGPNPSAVDQTQGDLDPPDENPDNHGTAGGETLQPTDSQGRVTIGILVEPANGSDGSGNVALTAFYETDDDNDPEPGEPQDTSTKTWVLPAARTITCEPESASNPVNTQHQVRCTVRDQFGALMEGQSVTFTEEGPGDFTSRGTRTNASGQVVAVTTSSEGGTQTIIGTIDDDLQGNEPGEVDECDRPAAGGAPAGACSDSVTKTWVPAQTSPTQFERDVTVEAQKPKIVFGKNVTLGGTVESDATAPTACTQFVSVDILRDVVGGTSEFVSFATVQTDESGAFSHDFRADVSANYIAEVEELAQCGAATSDAEPVLVKTKVSLRLSDSQVRRGARVRFTVRTLPCPRTAGDRVLLFRAIDGQFGKVGSKRTNDRCSKAFVRRVREDSVFQARWPKQAEELLAGKSRSKVVRVMGRRR